MMFNKMTPTERTSRFWHFDGSEEMNDGPAALVRELGSLAWVHRHRLIACTVAGFILAGLYAHSLPRTYVSTATLLLEPRQAAIPGQDAGPQQNLDLNRADSELQIISSERLLSEVFGRLNLEDNPELGPQPPSMIGSVIAWAKQTIGLAGPSTPDDVNTASKVTATAEENARQAAFGKFSKHLAVRRVGQSYVIEIQYTSVDPSVPARVANAAVSGYIMQAVSFKAETVRARSEALQGRLEALAAQVTAASDAMKRGELPAIPTPDADARVIGAALPPLAPSGPRVTLITILGGILGFLAGSSLIALNFARDRKVTSAEELARETGVPCLGSFLDTEKGYAGPFRELSSDCAVSIRDLRTSIEISCSTLRNERSLVIAFVAWGEGELTSFLSMGLSQLIKAGSRDVTLFQSAEWFHRLNENDGAPSHSLVDIALSDLQPGPFSFQNIRGVAVLPIHSTNVDANLLADFRHPRVSKVLTAARDRGDVILDLPPITNSKDALALATYADAVIFVAHIGKTSIGEVNSAVQQLRRARAKVIGTVLCE